MNWIRKHINLLSAIVFGAFMAGFNQLRAENPHILSFIGDLFIFGTIWYLVQSLVKLLDQKK